LLVFQNPPVISPNRIPSASATRGTAWDRVITDLGESSTLGSVGYFGWDGAATTNVRIDPKEQTVAIVAFQQTPTDPDIIDLLTNGYYAALND
jgi:CubicO group peptidase (beta-lactamase class C family)